MTTDTDRYEAKIREGLLRSTSTKAYNATGANLTALPGVEWTRPIVSAIWEDVRPLIESEVAAALEGAARGLDALASEALTSVAPWEAIPEASLDYADAQRRIGNIRRFVAIVERCAGVVREREPTMSTDASLPPLRRELLSNTDNECPHDFLTWDIDDDAVCRGCGQIVSDRSGADRG